MTPLMTLKKLILPANGIGHGLEDHGGGGLGVGDFARDDGGVGCCAVGGLGYDGRALDGRGRVDLEEVEEVIEGHVGEAA